MNSSNELKKTTYILNNTDKSQKYHFEQKKPGIKEHTLFMIPNSTVRNHLLSEMHKSHVHKIKESL